MLSVQLGHLHALRHKGLGRFTQISCRPTNCAMKFGGARSAPICTQAVFMAHFAGWCDMGVQITMRATSADPKSTQHTPLTICFYALSAYHQNFLLSSERISELFAKTSKKIICERIPPLLSSKKCTKSWRLRRRHRCVQVFLNLLRAACVASFRSILA